MRAKPEQPLVHLENFLHELQRRCQAGNYGRMARYPPTDSRLPEYWSTQDGAQIFL